MDAAMIEAVPARSLAAVAKAVEERLPAIRIEHVVLSGNEEDGEPQLLQHLLRVVELFVTRELGHVACVDDEIWTLWQRLYLGDCLPEGRSRIGVGRLVEADVAVADLRKCERLKGRVLQRGRKGGIQADRTADAPVEGKQRTSAGPSHTL